MYSLTVRVRVIAIKTIQVHTIPNKGSVIIRTPGYIAHIKSDTEYYTLQAAHLPYIDCSITST